MAKGSKSIITTSQNKPAVMALREIAAGYVGKAEEMPDPNAGL